MKLLFNTLTIVSLLGLGSLSLADKNNENISGDTNYPDLTAANLTTTDLTATNLGVTHLTETDLSTAILTEIENGKTLAEAGFDAN
ncbi:hypothetical protein ARAF_1644 [Arsenophonus endosymbiont of Aleurodicus floccissimus]|uniref:hypothetical protein n=1 Tax=Arsenophonus endosymbiont of Aleurodicus floccissimus TaxID=2152761 RepID=UPI000E6B47D6|nr:hypothetical protein [Arsenophonus endosymbiont of Aleurodicus floccissimus]SPP31975.1 hypothetical protein ARAF_1644 [Arsenophonus endosymbiont of Aleurodicus floccissimus]